MTPDDDEEKGKDQDKQIPSFLTPNPNGPGFIIQQADVPELLDQDISWGIAEHKTPNPKRGDLFVDTENKELYVCFVDGTWVLIAEGSGSVLAIEFSDAQLGGSDIIRLNFGAGFDGTESPDTQINITLDHSELAFPAWSDTGITGAELEDLSDGGETSIHTHSLDHNRSHDHSNAADDSSIAPVSVNISTFLQLSGETLITVASSPQNDFDPNGVGATMAGVLIDPDTVAVTISGMVKAGDGHVVFITNRTGTNDLILEDEGTGSGAANRFTFSNSADITLKGDEGVWLRYDLNTSRWKCIGEHRPQAFAVAGAAPASHDYDVHTGGVPFAEVEYDDATSDPLPADSTAAADGTEGSAARKDHRHLATSATSSVRGIVELASAGEATGGTADRVMGLSIAAALHQAGAWLYGTDAGGDDAYTVLFTPTITGLTTGMLVAFEPSFANVGAATLQIEALTAKPIKKHHDQDLATGDIEVGQIVLVQYDGTNFQMQSQLGNAPSGSGSMTTVEHDDAAVGDADIVTLNFLEGLDASEDPDTQINVSLETASSTNKGGVELASAGEATGGSADRVLNLSIGAQLVQAGVWTYKADTASDDTYLVSLTPNAVAYTKGMIISFEAQTANTGACTLNVDGIGAKAIKKQHDVDLADNDIEANQIVVVQYDGTNFQMQSPVANSPTAGAHGPSAHTSFANWKLIYTDGSGDQQELTLPAVGGATVGYQFLRSTGTAAAPEFQEIMHTKTITVEDPAADENIGVWFTFQAITIRELECSIVGSTSVTIDPFHDLNRSGAGGAKDILTSPTAISATTSVNIAAASLNDATIPADSWIILETTALSGTPTQLSVTFRYTID